MSDWLRARRDRTRDQHTLRREAYQAFLAAAEGAYSNRVWVTMNAHRIKRKETDLEEGFDAFIGTVAEGLVGAILQVDTAVAGIQLVGPEDVAQKAEDISLYMTKTPDLTSTDATAGLQKLIKEWLTLARPHAGIEP